MKVGICNFANQKGNYIKMQERLKFSLEKVAFDGELYFYNHESHISMDCPYHQSNDASLNVVPYAFKPYAMLNAIEDDCDIVIWMDSAIYATKSIQPLIDHIVSEGYIFFDNVGYSIGDFTSDRCLEYFNWSREKAFNHKMIMACLIGIDTRNIKAMKFFSKYMNAAEDKIPYLGSWDNSNGDCSADTRVMGHRHDQSAASIIIANLGLTINYYKRSRNLFCIYFKQRKSSHSR